MSVSGLDLGYWKRDSLWLEGWRPDGFFQLPEADQKRIAELVEAGEYSWVLARRLTEEAVADSQEPSDG